LGVGSLIVVHIPITVLPCCFPSTACFWSVRQRCDETPWWCSYRV